LLKARRAYVGEKVVLAVTPLDVLVVELLLGGRIHRVVRRWARHEMLVVVVPAVGRDADPAWPAVWIARASRTMGAELRPRHHDAASRRVLDLILSGTSVVESIR
jgi:hypothetical protein